MSQPKVVYVITKNKDGKSFWNRIGSAFENRDGSINVKLDALPVSGEMQIREYVPRDEQPSKAPRAKTQAYATGEGDDDIPF